MSTDHTISGPNLKYLGNMHCVLDVTALLIWASSPRGQRLTFLHYDVGLYAPESRREFQTFTISNEISNVNSMTAANCSARVIMRPSSLGGGRILRRTLSVRLSVRASRYRYRGSVRHLANYNDTHVLFGTRWGPHIVRPSRPHRFLLNMSETYSGDLHGE